MTLNLSINFKFTGLTNQIEEFQQNYNLLNITIVTYYLYYYLT